MNIKFALSLAIAAVMAGAIAAGGERMFAKPRDTAANLPNALAEVSRAFYGGDNYASLLLACLDRRPDGTPNIVLERSKGRAEFTVRLFVNDVAYLKWQQFAHETLKPFNLEDKSNFSDMENVQSQRIGGKVYYFGDNEREAIKRARDKIRSAPEKDIHVTIYLRDRDGNAVRTKQIALSEFSRIGFLDYPLPLKGMNRLKDLPLSSGSSWYDSDAPQPYNGASPEDSYAKFTFFDFTDEELNRIETMECEVR